MFIDTHSHLFLDAYDADRKETVLRALHSGVEKIVLPNIDAGTVDAMLELADEFPGQCFPAIGLHPLSVQEDQAAELEKLSGWLHKRKFVAIGETGIDLHHAGISYTLQVRAFRSQVGLAIRYDLPLIMHCRNSIDEVLDLLGASDAEGQLRGVFHCFTGTVEQAERIRDAGFMMGIGGVLTFKNSGLDEVVEKIPLENIVLETDAPYLAPAPFRGKRNESAFLPHTAEKLAGIHGLPVEEVAAITTGNARRLFKLD